MTSTTRYRSEMIRRFWSYKESRFPDMAEWFDRTEPEPSRPPVFTTAKRSYNVLAKPGDDASELRGLIPEKGRHRWFGSMFSSQALAQSVFGNLQVSGLLNLLTDVQDDLGRPLIGAGARSCRLESSIGSLLGEPAPTSLDVRFYGEPPIAFECKLAEQEVGTCSQPAKESSAADSCDGTRPLQRVRATGIDAHPCPLTVKKITYWTYVPTIFTWPAKGALAPCPLHANYQLVRNVLAVCVRSDGQVSPGGRAVLIYDERNPAFAPGGRGDQAFNETRAALKPEFSGVLRRCSWRAITRRLRHEDSLAWLTGELEAKYGL